MVAHHAQRAGFVDPALRAQASEQLDKIQRLLDQQQAYVADQNTSNYNMMTPGKLNS